MSLVGKIQSLFLDREKTQPIFPITKVKAVSDDNGRGLNVLLDDKASKDFVTAKIAEAQLGGGSDDIDLSGFATKDELNAVNNKIPTTPEQIGAHPNTWLPTIAQIGAAPSGYGYGGTPKTGAAVFSNLSEMGLGLTASCTTEAFVKALKSHSNVQFMHNKDNAIHLTDVPFDYGTVEFHKGANDNYIYGIGVDIKANIYVYKYHSSQNSTNGWYYDNPPMQLGVEYRTTKQYKGKPVYTMMFNFSKMPNNSKLTILTPVTNVTEIVSVSGIAVDSATTSSTVNATVVDLPPYSVQLKKNGNVDFSVTTTTDMSSYTATITLEYTKI